MLRSIALLSLCLAASPAVAKKRPPEGKERLSRLLPPGGQFLTLSRAHPGVILPLG